MSGLLNNHLLEIDYVVNGLAKSVQSALIVLILMSKAFALKLILIVRSFHKKKEFV